MLSNEQVTFFDTFGFLALRGLLSAEEMAVIDSEFEEVMAEDRAGQAFRGDKRHAVTACAEKRSALRALIDDDRIYSPMKQLLGDDFMWWGSGGNYYIGDTAWHSDGSDVGLELSRIKVAFYLDPVTSDAGCLRFIPGSHKPPLHHELELLKVERIKQTIVEGRSGEDALDPYRQEGVDLDQPTFGVQPQDLPAYPVESEPGDVLMFNLDLYHASFGGKVGRRMFTLNYCTVPRTEGAVAEQQKSYNGSFESIRTLGYSDRASSGVHEEAVLNSDRPRMKQMVKPLIELGFV